MGKLGRLHPDELPPARRKNVVADAESYVRSGFSELPRDEPAHWEPPFNQRNYPWRTMITG
jgi:hypothetical protein